MVTVDNSETPSMVLDLPVSYRASRKIFPLHPVINSCHTETGADPNPVLAYWRGQPITKSNNCTTALVGDQFTQASNLPIGENNKRALLFVFPVSPLSFLFIPH